MKNHSQITIIPNRHRANVLREFRELVDTYFERAAHDTAGVPMDWEGAKAARSRINRMLPRVVEIVRAAGVGAQAAGTGPDSALALVRVELLQRIFSARLSDGMDQQIFDILDMARGVYDGDQVFALARTVNPLHYVGMVLSFLARGPRALFAALGFGRPRTQGLRPEDVARLEAAVARLANIEALIETRFADLQDRQAMRNEDHNRQLVELAERLDFAERVMVQQRSVHRIEEPERRRVVTPV